eukprot:2033201-Rhodomonas_salina.1
MGAEDGRRVEWAALGLEGMLNGGAAVCPRVVNLSDDVNSVSTWYIRDVSLRYDANAASTWYIEDDANSVVIIVSALYGGLG